jgi:hypothetical protein
VRRPMINIAIWMTAFLIPFAPHVVASRDLILEVNGQNIHVQTMGGLGPTGPGLRRGIYAPHSSDGHS